MKFIIHVCMGNIMC